MTRIIRNHSISKYQLSMYWTHSSMTNITSINIIYIFFSFSIIYSYFVLFLLFYVCIKLYISLLILYILISMLCLTSRINLPIIASNYIIHCMIIFTIVDSDVFHSMMIYYLETITSGRVRDM